MNKLQNKISFNNKFVILWCCIVAFTMTFFFTSNSPFFRYDTWADSSVYTQVGRAWVGHGVIPYKEIFDHKGPLHFLLFGVGALLKIGNAFTGIYIIEALLMSLNIYYYFKTINIFIKSTKVSLLIATLIQLIMFTTVNFAIPDTIMHRKVLLFEKGGSPEEFCMPFISIMVYFSAKFSSNSELKLSKFQWSLFGMCCSLIFLEKFTLSIPFIILFGAAIIWTAVKEKSHLKNALIFGLSSFIVPLVITVLYFKLNGALSDFITYYFKVNLFNYGDEVQLTMVQKLFKAVTMGISMLTSNYLLFAGFIGGLISLVLSSKQSSAGKWVFMYLFASVYIISLIPCRYYSHYLLPVMPIVLVGYGLISTSKLEQVVSKGFLLKLVSSLVIIVAISLTSANELMSYSKINLENKTPSMERMASIIKSDKNFSPDKTNILVLFSNNVMIYTLTNTIPKTKFFYSPGMVIKQYHPSIINEINSKRPDYFIGFGMYDNGNFDKKRSIADSILKDQKNPLYRKAYKEAFKKYKVIYKFNDGNVFDRKVDYLFKRK